MSGNYTHTATQGDSGDGPTVGEQRPTRRRLRSLAVVTVTLGVLIGFCLGPGGTAAAVGDDGDGAAGQSYGSPTVDAADRDAGRQSAVGVTARFEVSNFQAPSVATGTITVSATVTNTGFSPGVQRVEYRVNGSTVDARTVALEPGASQRIRFSFDTREFEAGNYTHGVYTGQDSRTASIRIPNQSEFVILALNGPGTVSRGVPATVSATVINTGTVRTTGVVELRAGGVTRGTSQVSLGGGASRLVQFSLDTTGLTPGNYTLELTAPGDTATGSFHVRACSLGSFVGRYDLNSDCAIDINELGDAASDYALGRIPVGNLGRVAAAYARTLSYTSVSSAGGTVRHQPKGWESPPTDWP